MTKIILALAGLALASCLSTPATAGTTAYLSHNGTGSACSYASPCAVMNSALTAAGTAGEVICLDKGSYGVTTITVSVTISCGDGLWQAPFGFVIIDNAPSVFIEGLFVDGNGSGGAAFLVQGSGSLSLHHVRIGNNTGSTAQGMAYQPSGAGKLRITDSIFYNNGGSGSGGGIVIRPHAAGTAQVTLEGVIVTGNAFGIAADGTDSTNGINMTIADSMISGNANDGIVATTSSGHAPIGITVTNTRSVNNDYGIRSIGPGVTVRADRMTIIGNDVGLSFLSGGALLTAGTDLVRANATDGTFSGQVGLQ